MSAEEKANTWTHLIAFVATLIIAWPLLRLAYAAQMTNDRLQLVGTSLFVLGMLLMYGSSTLYHAVSAPVHKRRLRIFDHISIFVMIAGSYSPICISVIGGWLGRSLFAFLWGSYAFYLLAFRQPLRLFCRCKSQSSVTLTIYE